MENVCKECGVLFPTNRSARKYCGYSCSNAVNARERERRKIDKLPVQVWSCGGGVQSTAIAVLIEQGKLPKPEYALMTDCGYEQESTLEYVYGVTIPRMKAIGVTLHIIKTLDYSNNDIIDRGGHVTIPAYCITEKGMGRLHTHCNDAWKVKPAKRWMREQGIARAENWIGISTDEKKRARRSANKWVTLRYPLIELGMNREDCLWAICGAGWPKPPRSSCLFCPQQDDDAWFEMKQKRSGDWARAVEIERMIHKTHPNVFLHRTCRPLEQVFI